MRDVSNESILNFSANSKNQELQPTYPQYLWYPEVLANVSSSAGNLSSTLNSRIASTHGQENRKELKKYINEELVKKGLGIMDASDAELQPIVDQPPLSAYYFADMISRRAQIGWSTHGHSAVDVNLYGTVGSDCLRGNHENTEVGKFLQDYLDVDVDAITEELKAANSLRASNGNQNGWNGRIPNEKDLRLASNLHEERYSTHPIYI